jgi:hypothetical protein
MNPVQSIFTNISLPNAPTWFYFSGLLAVALFFKFSRLLSIRNLDVVTLSLPVPGLLLLLEPGPHNRWGYVWLLAASGFFLVRCLFDLALVRRPSLGPNLNLGGLAWLAGALFASLVAVAVRDPERPGDRADTTQTPIGDLPLKAVQSTPAAAEVDGASLRLWVERGLTLACHFAVAVGLVVVGRRHFEDLHAGMAAATFYLLLPYTYLLMPGSGIGTGRWDHAWPAALVVWAVVAYRRPTVAGSLLGLAAGSVFVPVVLLPVWLSFYRRRGLARFATAYALGAALCLAGVGVVLWVSGELPRSLQSAWALANWEPWKEPPAGTNGFWRGPDWSVLWVFRLPVFVVHLAFLASTLVWPSPKNLAHVLALSTAALLGIQFWYADQGGVHVLWYLPLLLLLVFRPNLTACQPPPPPADDWQARLGRRLGRAVLRLFRQPEPAAPAA